MLCQRTVDNLILSAETVTGWMLEMCTSVRNLLLCEKGTRILYLALVSTSFCRLDPKQFVELLELTSFYSRVCTR